MGFAGRRRRFAEQRHPSLQLPDRCGELGPQANLLRKNIPHLLCQCFRPRQYSWPLHSDVGHYPLLGVADRLRLGGRFSFFVENRCVGEQETYITSVCLNNILPLFWISTISKNHSTHALDGFKSRKAGLRGRCSRSEAKSPSAQSERTPFEAEIIHRYLTVDERRLGRSRQPLPFHVFARWAPEKCGLQVDQRFSAASTELPDLIRSLLLR